MKENTIYEIMTHNKTVSSKQKEKAQLNYYYIKNGLI